MRFPRWPFWVWPAGGIAVVVVINLVLWFPHFVTSGPPYCLTCHATGDTPDVGKGSLVHPPYSRVGCTECHASPGQTIIVEGYRGGYSAKPERVSFNCLRCHEGILSDEESDYKFNELQIRITHRFHLETAGAICADCHRNIAHDLSPEPTNRPRMEYCYECHSRSDSCVKCHEKGLPEFAKPVLPSTPIAAPSGPPAIPHPLEGRSNCLMCHEAGLAGAPKIPSDHSGRTSETCLACHAGGS